MAGKSDAFETSVLDLIFNAVAIANIADNAASSPATAYFIGLHTADPGESGTQLTSEATYTNYARASVGRTTTGWTVAAGVATLQADITFALASSGPQTITHALIGTLATGAGVHLFSGTVTPNIVVNTGVTPRLTTASTVTED